MRAATVTFQRVGNRVSAPICIRCRERITGRRYRGRCHCNVKELAALTPAQLATILEIDRTLGTTRW